MCQVILTKMMMTPSHLHPHHLTLHHQGNEGQLGWDCRRHQWLLHRREHTGKPVILLTKTGPGHSVQTAFTDFDLKQHPSCSSWEIYCFYWSIAHDMLLLRCAHSPIIWHEKSITCWYVLCTCILTLTFDMHFD